MLKLKSWLGRNWPVAGLRSFFVLGITGAVFIWPANYANPEGGAKGKAQTETAQDRAAVVVADYTEVLAWFTGVLAVVAIVGGCFTWSQIRLGRDEFNATHRPKITTRFFRPNLCDSADKISVFFQIVNEGAAKAIITEIGTRVFCWTGPWTRGAREVQFHVFQSNAVLESGQEERIFTQQEFARTEILRMEQDEGNFWWCIGYIAYMDESGVRRRTGFCRKWNFETKTWDREPNDDWEYSY